MDWYTLVTALISSYGIPLLTKWGLTVTPQVAAFINTAAIGGLTGLVHFFETFFKQRKVADAAAAPGATAASVASSAGVVSPLNPNAGVGGVVKMLPLFLAIGLAVSALGLSGCATIGKIFTPTAAPYVQVAVDVAVATAVGTDSTTQAAKATRIKVIAQQLLAADSSSTATLSAIEAVLNAKLVSLNLPAGDLAAAELLTNTLAAVVQAQLANPDTAAKLGTAQVQIAVVLNDVITATSAYGV